MSDQKHLTLEDGSSLKWVRTTVFPLKPLHSVSTEEVVDAETDPELPLIS